MAAALKRRVSSFFRSPRVRTVILLYCTYESYSYIKRYDVLYKTFSSKFHRPGETILDLDLDDVQLVTRDSRTAFRSSEQLKLHTLIHTLATAQRDPRVTGLVVRGSSGLSSLGLAEVCELRTAVTDFSQGWGGKQTMLHVPEGLGLSGNGTIPLYFASAFDSIHVQPTSGIIVPGLSMATLFFKRMLENVGLKAKKVARKEFKTAANTFTEEKYTEPHRETTLSLLKAMMQNLVRGISEGRQISEQQVYKAIDTAVMSAFEAQNYGIIDDALYRDELPEYMRKRLGEARMRKQNQREEVEKEWREAMKQLKGVWESQDGWNNLWDQGNLIRQLSSFQFALPRLLLGKEGERKVLKETHHAEMRALNAHIAWLDTCPWEAQYEDEKGIGSVYDSIPHISLLMATERQLCVNALETLKELPILLNRYEHSEGKAGEMRQEGFRHIAQWYRGVWRTKSYIARMVGTLEETREHFAQPPLKSDSDLETEASSTADQVFEPRLFLVGYADEYAKRKLMPESDKSSTKGDGQDGSNSSADLGENAHFRHVKFVDYIELVNKESRVSSERAFRKNARAHDGGIDHHERKALLQLQLPGHTMVPWKLDSSPKNKIAIIHIDGPVSDAKADVTRAAIRRADKDPNVQAIVLRIETPGGSATASDLISRAVEVAEKPVVASMGSVCASGGYFIAAPCDKIFASAMTITGSIGVIFQSFNTSALFEKLGITADSCESGRFAKYFGPMAPITEWTDDFSARVDNMIDKFYADFVQVVARGRKMIYDDVEKIARGRVWAGSDALRLGLVDEIGGLTNAISAAADLAFLPRDTEVDAIEYPTIAMQVQDAARRRGLIPSNLDEEGDEVVHVKRRRILPWGGSNDPPEKKEKGDKEKGDKEKGVEISHTALPPQIFSSLLGNLFVSILLFADNLVSSQSAPTHASYVLKGLMQEVLGALGGSTKDAVAEEIEKGMLTSGRPAAIAPSFRLE